MLVFLLIGGVLGAAMLANTSHDDDPDIEEVTLTEGDDTAHTSNAAQKIYALAGDDIVWAHDGNDIVYGEEGDDTLYGGPGNDTLYGAQGNDQVTGDLGNDVVDLGTGDDTNAGGDILQLFADDTLEYVVRDVSAEYVARSSVAGNDTVYGGAGSDEIIDLHGANTLDGGPGDDYILGTDALGTAASDVLLGGTGNDFLYGDDGDTLDGEEGQDEYVIWFGEDTDQPTTIQNYQPGENVSLIISSSLFDEDDSGTLLITPATNGTPTLIVSINGYDVAVIEGTNNPDDLLPSLYAGILL